jgi:hypothetical protein
MHLGVPVTSSISVIGSGVRRSNRSHTFYKPHQHHIFYIYKKLSGFGPRANYADRATAACWQSSANFCG